jgi:hypothetical protein
MGLVADDLDLIHLAQDKFQWPSLVNRITGFPRPHRTEDFLIAWRLKKVVPRACPAVRTFMWCAGVWGTRDLVPRHNFIPSQSMRTNNPGPAIESCPFKFNGYLFPSQLFSLSFILFLSIYVFRSAYKSRLIVVHLWHSKSYDLESLLRA